MTLTQARVRELFQYREGALYWRIRPTPNMRIGDICGTDGRGGYRQIQFDGRKHYAHRLIWLWHFAEVPKYIDHIDGNPKNNQIANLRAANHSQNNSNCGKRSNNTSGFKGVSWYKRGSKFQAQIRFEGHNNHLGFFDDPETAHAAYVVAANRLHGAFARTA